MRGGGVIVFLESTELKSLSSWSFVLSSPPKLPHQFKLKFSPHMKSSFKLWRDQLLILAGAIYLPNLNIVKFNDDSDNN